jgi:AcrR family transcriptional regulator
MGAKLADGRVVRAKAMREQRRAAILDAAAQVFAEKGYEAGSIADVIEAAGIARGTFYLHFDSKRAVFEELLDWMLAELSGALVRVDVRSSVPSEEQLLANIVRVLDLLTEHPGVSRILLHGSLGLDKDLGAKREEFFRHVRDLIKGSLKTGRRIGLVRPLPDLDLVAAAILGSLKEVLERYVVNKPPKRIDKVALAGMLMDHCLRGVLALG